MSDRSDRTARSMQQRDRDLAALSQDAATLLVGRTVVGVVAAPHLESCDSPNILRLTLDNGSVVELQGGYGGYSGESCDEYVETLDVRQVSA